MTRTMIATIAPMIAVLRYLSNPINELSTFKYYINYGIEWLIIHLL